LKNCYKIIYTTDAVINSDDHFWCQT